MAAPPPYEVIQAIERGSATIVRRAEVFESDGVTPWLPVETDTAFNRLIDGSVSVDYNRDERRTLDITLLNDDKLLRSNPNGGLWYDKVIKIFRGVTYPASAVSPAIAIIEATGTTSYPFQLRTILAGLGFTRTDVLIGASIGDLSGYDIIVADTSQTDVVTSQATLLKQAYDAGKSILTMGTANTGVQVPFITGGSAVGAGSSWGVTPPVGDSPVAGGWSSEAASTAAGYRPSTIDSSAQIAATWTASGTFTSAIAASNTAGGRWFDLHLPDIVGANAKKLLQNGINWLRSYQPFKTWECQLGEFMIDSISEDHFPYVVRVTGRDFTKKCLISKLEKASTFTKTTRLDALIKALAINAGITKMNIPATPETLGSDMSFDRGTPRWEIMKQAANTFGYEIYFDEVGYLTMRKYQDPSFSPIVMTFKTGPEGNLVSYSRTVNDSRLYNHICVYGDPAEGEADRLPYFGEAKNEDPSSPTRIARIGDRLYTYASTFFTNDQQAKNLANTYLKIHALESYELNFGSIAYPWLDVGGIVAVLDPDALPIDPTRFLLDTLTINLALGPMDMTAKRVTFVNDPNSGAIADDE